MPLKLKPLLCVVFGIYAFTSSYPGSFTASHSYAEQQVNCKTVNDEQKVITWTGDCINGLLDGDGEVVFEMFHTGKMAKVKMVSKFNRGEVTGVYYTKSYTTFNELYWSMLQVSNDSITIAAGSPVSAEYNDLNMKWFDKRYSPEIEMTFDEAFTTSVARAKKLNQKSIDPYTLKEYLSGRYKFNKADSQAQTVSPDLADNANAADDPQVFGGSSSPKASKRKK